MSRDGGCSFSIATSQLLSSDPGNISEKYLTAVDVGPTGEICVVSADASSDNGVFCSTDDAMTFALRAGLPNVPEYRTIKIAPSDPHRLYVSAHEISQPNPEGGLFPPTGHLYRSDDDGGTWTEEMVANLVSAPSPQLDVMAVSPANAEVVFLRSTGAHPPEGDVLLRSTDGAVTFADVLETTDAIDDVVAEDASTILVVTSSGTLFRSSDGGVTFDTVPGAPPLTCLGLRSDGTLFGCAALADPAHDALYRSTDGMTWKRVLALEYITGPLECPLGTAEHDICDQSDWRTVATQLGVVTSTCGAGPDPGGGPPVDAPPGATPPARGGCCDSGWQLQPRFARPRRLARLGDNTHGT